MLRVAIVCAIGLLTASRADAENYGVAASGNWFDAATWIDSLGATGVPGVGDGTFIGAPGVPAAGAVSGATVTLSANATVSTVNVGSYESTAGNGTLVLSGGVLSAAELTLDSSGGGAAALDFAGGDAAISGALSIIGTGVTLTRTAGVFSAADLAVADGASLALTAGDAVSTSVTLTNGASLALGGGLALGGNLSVTDATLDLDDFALTTSGSFTLANGGVVNRGVGDAGTLAAAGFAISGITSFTAQAGDSFSGAGGVSGGATFTANTPVAGLSSLTVTGAGSSFFANAQVSGAEGSLVTVTDGATLTVNAGLTSGTLSVVGATLELNGGTLDVSTLLLGDGTGAATINRGGGSIDAGSVAIGGGTAIETLAGDAFDSLAVTDGTVTVTQAPGDSAGLWIRNASDGALTIDVIGGLVLAFDAEAAVSPLDWILKWNGDRVTALGALLDGGYVTVNMADYRVFYDDVENATFVAVPEPTPLALAVIGLAASGTVMVRRRNAGRRPAEWMD